MSTQLSTKIDQLGEAWESFKEVNDQRLKTLEKKSYDPLVNEKLTKINKSIDSLSTKSFSNQRPEINSNSRSSSVFYKKAFDTFLRKGVENEIATLPETQNVENGYAVSEGIATSIEMFLSENSTMRQLTDAIKISHHSFDAVKSNAQMNGAWGDGSVIADVTNFEKKVIQTYDLTAQPKVTQRLLDDSEVDLELWIANKVGEIFVNQENQAFIKGTGVNQPKGVMNDTSIQRVATAANGVISVDDLMNLYYSLDDLYIRNAAFLMNRQTVHKIRTLKDNSGNYLWMPGLLSNQADTLLGLELHTNQAIDSVESGKDAIVLGNFKQGYQIVDRGQISIQRDPYTMKPFVIFAVTKRTGGDVVNSSAFKIMNIA